MSQENVETYRQAVDAFNRRDRVAWSVVGDPAVVNIPPREWPESRRATGLDAVWDQLVANMDAWEEQQLQIVEVVDAGSEKIGAQIRSEVTGKSSGAAIAWTYWHVVTFRDGKIVRSEWFADRVDALEAAGLSA